MCSQSLLVQETQSEKDPELTCSTTFLFRDATCLQVGPMSLDWPVNPFGRSDSSRPLLPPDVPSGEQHLALPASVRSRWRQGALQAQPQMMQRTTGWDGCGPFPSEGFRCFAWNTRGLVGSGCIIRPHWPAYPYGVGVILGDFNICDPEEGRFNVWNQSFTDGDPG